MGDGGGLVPGLGAALAWGAAQRLGHWRDGGPTDLANLALVCPAHRAVHAGGCPAPRRAADRHPHPIQDTRIEDTATADIPPPPEPTETVGQLPLLTVPGGGMGPKNPDHRARQLHGAHASPPVAGRGAPRQLPPRRPQSSRRLKG